MAGRRTAAWRDLALVIEATTPSAEVQKKLTKAARTAVGNAFALESVSVFDVYQGKGLPDGKKSLAFNLVFRSAERTFALLTQVARRILSCLRPGDTLARLGGDEFVLILRGGSDDYLTPQIIERLVASVSEPIAIEGLELTITCSVGISTYPVDGRNAEELILQADTAMYLAKGSGHNRYQFYNKAIEAQLDQRAIVETELQHALEKREFYLVYQPQVSLKTGRISGVEALLRWANPRLGELMPEQFLPLAEKTALINAIGAWVVNEAVQQAASWEREGLGAGERFDD